MTNSVQVRLYAAARSAAGVAELQVGPGTLSEILSKISYGNTQLENVILRCSFLIDGMVSHNMETEVSAESTIDILPPFAGG